MNIITENIELILTGIGTFISTWLLKGKIVKAEGKSAEANALEAMQKAYDMYVEHNNAKMKMLEEDVKKINTRYSELEKELERVEKYWKNKYNALLKDFRDYKKDNPK